MNLPVAVRRHLSLVPPPFVDNFPADASEGLTGLTTCAASKVTNPFRNWTSSPEVISSPEVPGTTVLAKSIPPQPKATPQALSHAAEIAEPRGRRCGSLDARAKVCTGWCEEGYISCACTRVLKLLTLSFVVDETCSSESRRRGPRLGRIPGSSGGTRLRTVDRKEWRNFVLCLLSTTYIYLSASLPALCISYNHRG